MKSASNTQMEHSEKIKMGYEDVAVPYHAEPGAFIMLKRLSDTAKIPTKDEEFGVGYDLYADNDDPIIIQPGAAAEVPTNIALDIPTHIFAAVFARYNMSTKYGIRPSNCVGIIDPYYHDALKVGIHNDSLLTSYTIHKGDKIAQLVFMPYYRPIFGEEVDDIKE